MSLINYFKVAFLSCVAESFLFWLPFLPPPPISLHRKGCWLLCGRSPSVALSSDAGEHSFAVPSGRPGLILWPTWAWCIWYACLLGRAPSCSEACERCGVWWCCANEPEARQNLCLRRPLKRLEGTSSTSPFPSLSPHISDDSSDRSY